MECFDSQWGPAIDLIRYSKHIIALTGAGISTESGIPDFRSVGGLWEKFDPMKYANYYVFLKHPEYYWELERSMTPIFAKAKPNAAHKALVDLENMGRLKAIITQNIDGFHQMAGSKVPIIEMHGNVYEARCLDCSASIKRGYIMKQLKESINIPVCPICGGRIKTGTILFNEPIGDQKINDAFKLIKNCDLLLILGTSLNVYPVNLIPLMVRKAQGKLFFINKEPTGYDKYASIRLLGNVSSILPAIIQQLGR